MKLWKLTASMLLCLGFAFAAMSCDDFGNSGDKTSDSSPEISDTSGSSASSDASSDESSSEEDSSTDDNSSSVTENEWQEVSDWLEGVQSAKINFTIDADADIWTWDEEAGKPARTLLDATVSTDMWVTTSDNGADAKLVLSVDGKLADTMLGTSITLYYVDGEGYMYDATYDEYIASPVSVATILSQLGITEESIGAVIETVKTELGDLNITQDDLGGLIDEIFDLGGKVDASNGVMMTILDAKSYANGFLDVVLNWNGDVTLGEAINETIAYVTPEDVTPLTYVEILDNVAALGDVTANETYTTVNDYAVEYTGFSVQELKDMLLAQEDVVSLLSNWLEASAIQEIKDFNISTFLASTGEGETKPYGEWKTDDLLALLQADSTEVLTLTDYTAQAEEFLSTAKFSDYSETLGVLTKISDFRFSDLSAGFGFKYTQDRAIDSFVVTQTVGVAGKWDFGTAEKPNEKDMSAKLTVTVSVSEVSATPLTIALPENATIVYVCAESLSGDCCGDSNTPIRLREEYALYLCDECYAVFEYDRCEGDCGAKAEDVVLRDNGFLMCDKCYQATLPPEENEATQAESGWTGFY